MRDLFVGPPLYSDLHAGLPGIPTNAAAHPFDWRFDQTVLHWLVDRIAA